MCIERNSPTKGLMMYKKLEELNRLNNAMNEIVANVDRCNEQLESEYKQQEEMRLDEFMDAMYELAGYAKNLSWRNFRTNIIVRKQRYTYNDWDEVLVFDFKGDGNFIISTNGNTHGICVYASEFADYDETGYVQWKYMEHAHFNCGWGYRYSKSDFNKYKKFIAIHANEILDTVQKMIEDGFDKEIKEKANKAYKKQSQIIVDIERVKK